MAAAGRSAAPGTWPRNSCGSVSSSSSSSGLPSGPGTRSTRAYSSRLGPPGTAASTRSASCRSATLGRQGRRSSPPSCWNRPVDTGVGAVQHRPLADRVTEPAAQVDQRGLPLAVHRVQVGLHHHHPTGLVQPLQVLDRQPRVVGRSCAPPDPVATREVQLPGTLALKAPAAALERYWPRGTSANRLPSGSSKIDHQPNGCWTGGTGNCTPRAVSSLWVCCRSSV
jgi:hypothetical protein